MTNPFPAASPDLASGSGGPNPITGPTGSGKPALLAPIVRRLRARRVPRGKAVEYSRPIESAFDGFAGQDRGTRE
jgi:Tfp pilus assembly pilus retraction ATPase PilT